MKGVVAIGLTLVLLASSCSNIAKKRIVSEIPIKTEVLGLSLCEVSNEKSIKSALTKETSMTIHIERERIGENTVYRAVPTPVMVSQLHYGTLSWHYMDILLNKDNIITEIRLVGSFEKIDNAKKQYDAACRVFANKYGNGNIHEENQTTFWTDNSNSVGLNYTESIDLYGNNRSFCTLYYVNIALSNEAAKSSRDV